MLIMVSCFSTKFQEKAEEYYDDSLRPDVITYTTLVKVSKQSMDLFTYLSLMLYT